MLQTIDKKKETAMRLFSYFVALIASITFLSIVLTGCSNDSIINSDPIPEQSSYQIIKLPMSTGMHVNNIYSDSKTIDGSAGGALSLSGSYSGGPFGTVSVTSTLEFQAGSFNGIKTITMTADDQYCASTFLPGMSFAKAGIYNITYTGVDLSGINPSTVSFVYLKQDGTLEYPVHEGITVESAIGKISVKNAKLNHFSRYGFVNKEN